MSQTDAERANPFEEGVLTAIRGKLAGLWTAIPGEIVSFDAARQTAEVQPTVQAEADAPDGSKSLVTLPLLLDCPVVFQRGGGAVFTFPIAPGDECLVVFSARCIDAWWQNGGVQPQAELRMHDLSDGFVFVGPASLPKAIGGLSTTSAQLRSLDGLTSISLNPSARTIALTAPGGILLDGPVTATSTIDAAGDVTAEGTSLHTHTHTGGTISGDTGVPI